ncbi:MAG: hypothetical protein SCARUB_04225 [Candidatus Scalindua rubra]|uniref:Uncharacterized protein n=1 Tax=Candidatus Scalindua rubra TaxID=1872076 RepID=A0A1E3X4V3_9BACT|nr:MAG: hypothetical protein SCARUB_04225 [Candidatus Scalindua rubra]
MINHKGEQCHIPPIENHMNEGDCENIDVHHVPISRTIIKVEEEYNGN